MNRKGKPLSVRISATLHDALVARAQQSGRSITQEVELLLELALAGDRVNSQMAEVIHVLSRVIHPLVVRAVMNGEMTINDARIAMGLPTLQ